MQSGLFSERGLREAVWRLASLAVLAEIAASRCLPVRWYVLGLMRNAERIVRQALVEQTGWNPDDVERVLVLASDPDGLSGSGSDPIDAIVMAWRLRALAILLGTFLPPAQAGGRSVFGPASAQLLLASQINLGLSMPAGPARAAPDTS